jgi:hypothetical protein
VLPLLGLGSQVALAYACVRLVLEEMRAENEHMKPDAILLSQVAPHRSARSLILSGTSWPFARRQ